MIAAFSLGLRIVAMGVIASSLIACAASPKDSDAAIKVDPQQNVIVAAEGARLPVREWLPEGPARAVVLGLHGFNDYSKTYESLGAFLAERGIATYAYDQRGFGQAPDRGYWPGEAVLTGDLATAAAWVHTKHPGAPLYCMGESMGGAVVMAAAALAQPPACDALILSSPAVWGRQTLPFLPRASLAIASSLAPDTVLHGDTIRIKPSDNVAVLRDLSRDPVVIKGARVLALDGLVDITTDAFAAADAIKLPVLYLYGGRDTLVPRVAAVPVMRKLRGRATLGWYPNGYHLLFRDLQAAVVRNDIASWILDRRAPLPSGADSYAAQMLDTLAASSQ